MPCVTPALQIGARRNQEDLGEARRTQKEPGLVAQGEPGGPRTKKACRRMQGGRKSQEDPKGTRRSQEESGRPP